MPHATPADKRRAFHRLHESGCFVIPNPWDLGSARMLQGLGFAALASTSSGYAWSRGHPDNGITRDMALEHLAAMAAALDVPLNADFENGFGRDAAEVADGLDLHQHLAGEGVLLVGRAEGFLHGRPDLDEAIARLKAYADAGADCLYAPGLRTHEQIAAVVAAVAPKPVNVLVGGASEWTVAQLAALGVRRISVGGALARAAWGGMLRAARLLGNEGRFDGFADAAPGKELNAFFSEDLARRGSE